MKFPNVVVPGQGPMPYAGPPARRVGAIEILRTDLIRTLKLLGYPAARALDRSYVEIPRDWPTA